MWVVHINLAKLLWTSLKNQVLINMLVSYAAIKIAKSW